MCPNLPEHNCCIEACYHRHCRNREMNRKMKTACKQPARERISSTYHPTPDCLHFILIFAFRMHATALCSYTKNLPLPIHITWWKSLFYHPFYCGWHMLIAMCAFVYTVRAYIRRQKWIRQMNESAREEVRTKDDTECRKRERAKKKRNELSQKVNSKNHFQIFFLTVSPTLNGNIPAFAMILTHLTKKMESVGVRGKGKGMKLGAGNIFYQDYWMKPDRDKWRKYLLLDVIISSFCHCISCSLTFPFSRPTTSRQWIHRAPS